MQTLSHTFITSEGTWRRIFLGLFLVMGWSGSILGNPIIDETEVMPPASPGASGEVQTSYHPDEILPIGLIQSPVTDGDDGVEHRSPFGDKEAMIQGVVHARILRKLGTDGRGYGFYIQNTPDTADGDPDTSDALFVWTGKSNALPIDSGVFTPKPGDELVLKGKIRDVYGLTQLTAPKLVRVVRRNADLDEVLTPFEVSPPDQPEDVARYWERREGMRCRLPAGCVLTSGRKVYDRTAEAEVWMMHPDRTAALRTQPYHRRVFRDAHPLDDLPDTLYDNENAYRIRVGSLGLKGATDNPEALISPLRTFDVTTRPAEGVVHQYYKRFSVEIGRPIEFERSVNPYANGRQPKHATTTHFTIGTFNVENLYDLHNDPYDDYDFPTDPGGPKVRKPFNYIPSDMVTYRARLRALAVQIVQGMQAPDIVMLQEVEDQDIAADDGDEGLTLPGHDDADGVLDALQELTVAIRHAGGPFYQAISDRDGADARGIICAFLYNPDRVERVRPTPGHPILGRDLTLDYRGVPLPGNRNVQNPKAVNAILPSDTDTSTGMSNTNVFSRAVQVALFKVHLGRGREDKALPVYILNNHFSSRPDRRVGQRIEQARLNAAIAQRILDENPGSCLVMGGDLNIFPRPDDPFEEPSDQLGSLYEAGLWNVYDYLLAKDPANAYTYVYAGQAQTLDQLFLSPALRKRLVDAWVPHLNSDWPGGGITQGRFGASDHEPVMATFKF